MFKRVIKEIQEADEIESIAREFHNAAVQKQEAGELQLDSADNSRGAKCRLIDDGSYVEIFPKSKQDDNYWHDRAKMAQKWNRPRDGTAYCLEKALKAYNRDRRMIDDTERSHRLIEDYKGTHKNIRVEILIIAKFNLQIKVCCNYIHEFSYFITQLIQ